MRGHNLVGTGEQGTPRVTVAGQPVAVIKASPRELLLAPQAHQWAGQLNVTHGQGLAASLGFDLSPFAPQVPAPTPLANGSAV